MQAWLFSYAELCASATLCKLDQQLRSIGDSAFVNGLGSLCFVEADTLQACGTSFFREVACCGLT